ncbi:lysozyme [Symbiopectobacterium sp. Eva_TO]
MPPLPDPLRKKLLAVFGASLLTIAACYTAFWEGHAPQPYADSGGVLTVCYGHTGGDITPEMTKTPAQCEALLAADMRQAFIVIDQHATVPLSDGQRVALAAFIHNVGSGAFARSTLLKRLNAGDIPAACDEFRRWVKVTSLYTSLFVPERA